MDKPTAPVPTALTERVHDAICQAIHKGVPLKYACATAHVGYSTVKEWLADGREFPGTPQAALLAGVEEAHGLLIDESLEVIREAYTSGKDGVPDWKARAWILERRYRGKFSQHQEQHIKITADEVGTPNFTINPRRHTVPSVEVDTNGQTNGSGEAT